MSASLLLMAVAAVFATACATGGLTRQDVLGQYDRLNELSTGLAVAEGGESALLAPEGHEKAHDLLDEAVERALDAEKTAANELAGEGLAVLKGIEEHMAVANEELSEVLETRERAAMEGAHALFAGEFEDADEKLREATVEIEHGEVSEARKLRPELMALYADLEVRALKEGKRAAAEAAIEKAEEMDADDYAPKTFEKAVEELALVSSVLEADRTNTEKADQHARNAIWLAGRAMAITELALMFERGDYESEDVVLWHQNQLELINRPLDQDLPFDESDAAAVQFVRESIEALLGALDDMRASSSRKREKIAALHEELEQQRSEYGENTNRLIRSYQQQLEELRQQFAAMKRASKKDLAKLQKDAAQKIAGVKASYEQELSAQAQAEAEAARQREAAEQRFDDVHALFDEDEAAVLRQGNNVLIRAHGFDFPRGGTDIGAKNFGLLDKLVSALNIFPTSKVLVTGHTDSRGNEDRNLRLSIERAESVVEFLTTVGKVKADRVQSKGLGETSPVASNDTKEGRTKNRRIDVLIEND